MSPPTILDAADLCERVCELCFKQLGFRPCETGECAVRGCLPALPAFHSNYDPRVSKVLSLINEHGPAQLSVKQLAREVGLSPTRLAQIFREQLGFSPAQYRARRRLEQAALMLQQTELSVKQVCYAVGWSDRSNFNHAFRRAFGRSPTAFRAETRA